MLTFEEAHRRVLALALPLGVERVALDEAWGRVLAAQIEAPYDSPPFDHSAMDGYAVRAADLAAGGVTLRVQGESRAGHTPEPLAVGIVCRVFTGAPLPEGADAVVMQEDVRRDGETAWFREAPRAGQHIRRRGEDLGRGATAITAGTRLGAAHVALAASCDRAWLDVARRPVVAILATGDELRPPGQSPPNGPHLDPRIPESNGPAIRAMARRAGAQARVLPPASDDRTALARALDEALRGADLLVSIGGVSVGDHDLVGEALTEIGAEIDLWKVAMKPGKPLLAGRRGDARVLGLPGNPTSAMVTFALFGVPLLRAMQGDSTPMPVAARARMSRPVPHAPGKVHFVRVVVAHVGEGLSATPLANQASGASASMAGADALARIEADRGDVAAGEPVDVLWLDELGV